MKQKQPARVGRRLAAIVAADVAGYSRLMGLDEVGTARMGHDPKSSFLNKWNQSWDVKNLFVTDGSCYVSQGCQNPTLTMMAITVRACTYIAEEYRLGNL